jgi:hypothetical protein
MKKVSFRMEVEGLHLIEDRTGVSFLRVASPDWFYCTVFDRFRNAKAACLAEPHNRFEVHFSVAVDDPGAVSRRLLRTIFSTLFSRYIRIVAKVEPSNTHSADVARRLGFQYAGFLRRGFDGDRDAYIFDMLREDCRWLPGYQGGTIIRTDFAGEPIGMH